MNEKMLLKSFNNFVDRLMERYIEFSRNYTDTVYIAYLDYKNTGLNLSPFRFGGGTPSTNQQSKHL
jgi:hypothetical protein